jgi:hypothetical protein
MSRPIKSCRPSSRPTHGERCNISTAEDAFDRVMRVDIFVDATNGGPREKKQHVVTVSVVIAILEQPISHHRLELTPVSTK